MNNHPDMKPQAQEGWGRSQEVSVAELGLELLGIPVLVMSYDQ